MSQRVSDAAEILDDQIRFAVKSFLGNLLPIDPDALHTDVLGSGGVPGAGDRVGHPDYGRSRTGGGVAVEVGREFERLYLVGAYRIRYQILHVRDADHRIEHIGIAVRDDVEGIASVVEPLHRRTDIVEQVGSW